MNDASPPITKDHLDESERLGSDKVEPIAVIGFSLRLPQDATSPDKFWQLLMEARSAMTEVPEDRYNLDAFYHPDESRANALNVRGAHFVRDDIGAFDAPFFSITPAEACCMDPQQRGLLESTYRALENAGIPIADLNGSKTGVYVGCFSREYETMIQRDQDLQAKYLGTGTGTSMLANRISWFFDLAGPSMALDTACSSSLNALHLACQSLRSGESSMGVVAGCNLFYNPDLMIPLTNLNFLSPDSKCHSFDHRANGYSRGEGFGVVIIKPLKNALRDGDTIRAVIRATGANQDGRTPGITQPSSVAQEALIRETYEAGGMGLNTTRFFEAHGTGTPLGDPVEASAIGAVFGSHRSQDEPLFIGALKSNIGHLEGASGIAGIIKTILVLEKGVIPPNIWFEKPNPKILVKDWNIKFPLEPTPWPVKGLRRASVNSFGFGGSNAHAVLEDADNYLSLRKLVGNHYTAEQPPNLELTSAFCKKLRCCIKEHCKSSEQQGGPKPKPSPKLLVWSASDKAGLKRFASVYDNYFTGLSECEFTDDLLESLAYTLGIKRSSLPWKSFTIAQSLLDLQGGFENRLSKPVRSSRVPKLAFVFTGQGAQYFRMGRELLVYADFRTSLEEADCFLKNLGCNWGLIDELTKHESLSNVDNPAYSQPLCTALQVALVDLLRTWEIFPSAVIGHSSGEIAAAYCIGGLSKISALTVAYFRGTLSANLASSYQTRGSMMSVGLSEAQAQIVLANFAPQNGEHGIAIGCVNSPENVTLTGNQNEIDALKSVLQQRDVFARKLKVGVAYHSTHMNEIAVEYSVLLKDITPGESSPTSTPAPMFSTLSGEMTSRGRLCQGEYWVKNLMSPVKFADALSLLCSHSFQKHTEGAEDCALDAATVDHLLEIGPHSALQGSIKLVLKSIGKSNVIEYSSLIVRNRSAIETSLEAVGHLHCLGYPVNLLQLNHQTSKPTKFRLLIDLPEYPFDHSQTYWLESRISKNFRFRKHSRHELLGAPVSDWNPLEPRWRHFLRSSEIPWIRDHKISGSNLYPAAGMLTMAIEAVRQVADERQEIKAYRFKDVALSKALHVSEETGGTEISFCLRPCRDVTASSFFWNDFRLWTYENDEWVENCKGFIGVEYKEEHTDIHDLADQDEDDRRSLGQLYADGKSRCTTSITSKKMYKDLEDCGYGFGPCFQTLKGLCCNDQGEAIAVLDIRDSSNKVCQNKLETHVIHPTALDGIFQSIFVALSKGGKESIPTLVPTLLSEAWISNSLLHHSKDEEMNIYSKSIAGISEIDSLVIGLSGTSRIPTVIIKGLILKTVASSAARNSNIGSQTRLCFELAYKPDIDLQDQKQTSDYCLSALPASGEDPGRLIEETELFCFLRISDALQNISDDNLTSSKPYLFKYLRWMKHQIENYNLGLLIHGRPEWKDIMEDREYKQSLFDRVKSRDHEGQLCNAVGENIVPILNGEVDPLSLFFEGKLVQDYYRWSVQNDDVTGRPKAYLDALAHKNPNLKILEIGAGTGSATRVVLDTLSGASKGHSTAPRFANYTFTDISPSFFEAAKDTFGSYANRMTFKTLDISSDPIQQGFDAEQYDLVVASNVFHATPSLDATLQNTRKLMKPGAKLMLVEICNLAALRVAFIFGLLPGWWSSTEENRRWSPLLSEKEWHEALSRNGLTGADWVSRDHENDRNHMSSTIISTAKDPDPQQSAPETIIVAEKNSAIQLMVAQEVQSRLTSTGTLLCDVIDLQDAVHELVAGKCCIFLSELKSHFLLDIKEDHFASLKNIITSARGFLWVTRGGGQRTEKPELNLVTGFARCIRSEFDRLNFVTLALEHQSHVSQMAQNIFKVFQVTMMSKEATVEQEYVDIDGLLCIPRIVEASNLNNMLFPKKVPNNHEMQKIAKANPYPVRLGIAAPGLLNSLEFLRDPIFNKPLCPDEVELKVKATGVNFKDIMIALGRVSSDHIGVECAGIIKRVGKNSNFVPGDRVCCIAEGTYKTFVKSKACTVAKIPDDCSYTSAAAIPIAYCTAYYALHDLGRIRKGASILVHCGAGGVGQAAIQLAKITNAKIFATVGAKEKKQLLMARYGIPEDHIFSSRTLSFAHRIKQMTGGRGVDIILNSLAGESLRRSWDCIASFGCFVDLGIKNADSQGVLSTLPFVKNVSFSSVNLSQMIRDYPHMVGDILSKIMALFVDRQIAPEASHIYNYTNLEDAYRLLQGGKNTGKVVVELCDDDLVPVVPSIQPAYLFDENATYLISGGLGGLGRSIARWMVDRGAKNLILLSRAGPRTEPAIALLEELKHKDVNVVVPACDVSNVQALASVLRECQISKPPIKGCIQGSMALKDAIFENMTLEDFNTALVPKVWGSWNLHALLPKGLDFFILLSSMNGILGSRSQANYGSGNTYQDALARYRVSRGEKAVSLDLPIILNVGFVAERQAIAESPNLAGYIGVTESQLHTVLDHYCNPSLPVLSLPASQVLVGVETPASMRSRGIEPPHWLRHPLCRHLFQITDDRSSAVPISSEGDAAVNFEALLRSAASVTTAGTVVCEALVQKLAKTLSLPPSDIDTNEPMYRHGLDSLIAVELRSWFSREMSVDVTVFEILSTMSIENFCLTAARKSRFVSSSI